MVWQDFALACAVYPQTEDFLAAVRTEARVGRRASCATIPALALWCGDNEIDRPTVGRRG